MEVEYILEKKAKDLVDLIVFFKYTCVKLEIRKHSTDLCHRIDNLLISFQMRLSNLDK